MMRTLLFFAPLLLLMTFCHRDMAAIAERKAIKNYDQYCVSCHGITPETFANHDWKYGKSRLQLIQSIRSKHPQDVAAKFISKLDDKEIMGVASYVLEGIVKHREKEVNVGGDAPTTNIFGSKGMTIVLDTFVTGLTNPWGIAFLPNGHMLVTDRGGKLYRIDTQKNKTEIKGTPEVLAEGQGGLLDVEVNPDFPDNGFIYLSYSKFRDSSGVKLSTTAVLRARLENDSLTKSQDIFVALPYFETKHHYGSRLEFDKKGYLYITVGDRGKQDLNPQNLKSDAGKIHRIFPDGRVPADNPFYGDPSKARGTIWSYGHRNPQGLAFNPETGVLWEMEHGPRGGDEINIVEQKKNYGWPVISYGTHYSGDSFTEVTEKEGMEQPQYFFIPSIGPSGLAFVSGNRYPAWKGNLLSGSLKYQYLNRSVISGRQVQEQEILLKNLGRMRCVVMGPDGYLYIGVEEPGFVYKLKPQ